MVVQQQNLSLNMSLLLFTLLSTALAVPAPCPPMPPMECGEGMINCPGPIDPMGCMMPEPCVAEGDACPFHCPPMPPMDCGEGMINCHGPNGLHDARFLRCGGRRMPLPLPPYATHGLRRGHGQLPRWHGRHGMHDARYVCCRRRCMPCFLNVPLEKFCELNLQR